MVLDVFFLPLSLHVARLKVILQAGGRHAHYKLTSTVMLWLQTNRQGSGMMNLGGSMTRQVLVLLLRNDVESLHETEDLFKILSACFYYS